MTKKSSSRSKKSRRGQAEIPYCYELFDPLQSHALLDLPREIQCMITCRFSLTNMKTWSVVLCRHCCLQSRPTVIESYLKSVCSSATTSLSFMKELSRLKVFDRLPYGVKAYLYHRSWKESMTIPAAPSRLQSIAFIKILNSRNSWTDVNVLTRALLWAVSNNFSEAQQNWLLQPPKHLYP
ncbi:hypothetical protein BCR33DRAFT_781691 [Rhizoclosmatium globosum]|uniref:Uncharacterized protein n=1 Tax=Rhizoclosmatium globosum TaxID=329046 RepID=A0A1Y2CQU7_9FUNG|nr:hypothetical protein BCR33DRAFT_781691 [Rhizoclosmatium globosum]|eukprot:ORY49419.1 hypothetical protein BCR33DRAFT_781691 [Rhizoclosmatium globosum]